MIGKGVARYMYERVPPEVRYHVIVLHPKCTHVHTCVDSIIIIIIIEFEVRMHATFGYVLNNFGQFQKL